MWIGNSQHHYTFISWGHAPISYLAPALVLLRHHCELVQFMVLQDEMVLSEAGELNLLAEVPDERCS